MRGHSTIDHVFVLHVDIEFDTNLFKNGLIVSLVIIGKPSSKSIEASFVKNILSHGFNGKMCIVIKDIINDKAIS